jgi:hypothetical protein
LYRGRTAFRRLALGGEELTVVPLRRHVPEGLIGLHPVQHRLDFVEDVHAGDARPGDGDDELMDRSEALLLNVMTCLTSLMLGYFQAFPQLEHAGRTRRTARRAVRLAVTYLTAAGMGERPTRSITH